MCYPLYLFSTMLLVVFTKWLVVGRYRAGSIDLDSHSLPALVARGPFALLRQ